jgi:Tfp pilus assembly protein PilF
MHKRKDEIQDIYQSNNRDFEADFTPQVAQEQIEERMRELRRSRIVAFFFGSLVLVLSVALVAVVIRDFLSERKLSEKVRTPETPYIPRYSLPLDALWVMDYQQVAAQAEDNEKPGPKPLSVKWVKQAAYHIVMGQQALAVNEPKQALEHLQKVVEIFPDIEGLHRAVGLLYLKREEYAPAAQHLEKALTEKEDPEVVNNLAVAYIGTEEFDKAEKHLKRLLELEPENPGCHKNLAVLYRKMKLDDKACFHFEKYIDLQPNDLDTMQTYALYLAKLGRWKEAADFLTKLTQEVTDVAPIYFLLAQVQVQNGQQGKAMDALKRGIQLTDPELALAWMRRDEFDKVRGVGDFKTLVDQLEIATVSLEKAGAPQRPGETRTNPPPAGQ